METMSESIESATQGATAPAVESVPQPATDTAPDTGQKQQAEPVEQATETPEEPKRKPWFQQRIDELTREKHEARRQVEAYATYLRTIQQGQQQPAQQQDGQPPPGYVPASEVGRIAAQQLEAQRFNDACNDIADHGETAFKDFQTAVQNFQSLGGPSPALLEAVTALGKEDGARVYYELGMNPDEAMRLARLSPARMAVEVAKMAAKPAATKPVSRVPPPIAPISAARAEPGGPPDAKRNPEAWSKWFAGELRNRNR
jgi:hypothetical protein